MYGDTEEDFVRNESAYYEEDESAETGLPIGTCGYCGGAHFDLEHMTDGEIAAEYRDANREPEEPDDY